MISTFAYFEMVDNVNKKLKEEERFAVLGWYYPKYQRLHHQYRTLYPNGRLLVRVRVLTALMFAFGLTGAWSFGFFAK